LEDDTSQIKIYGFEEVTEAWLPIQVTEDGELKVTT